MALSELATKLTACGPHLPPGLGPDFGYSQVKVWLDVKVTVKVVEPLLDDCEVEQVSLPRLTWIRLILDRFLVHDYIEQLSLSVAWGEGAGQYLCGYVCKLANIQ